MGDAAASGPQSGVAAFDRFVSQHQSLRTVDVVVPDLNGIPRGKRFTTEAFRSGLETGFAFPSSVYAIDTLGNDIYESGLVLEEGDADRRLRIDPSTFVPTPWLPGGAQVFAGVEGDDGAPFFADPRALLGRQDARFRRLGLTPVVAFELEFMLLAPGEPPRLARHAGSSVPDLLSIDVLDRRAGFLDRVHDDSEAQGLPVRSLVAEGGTAQFEVNLGHVPSAVRAADHALLLKRTARAAARGDGLEATFMAKPFADQAANGMHVHLSLVDEAGRNRFADDEAMLHHALGGLRSTMAEAMLIFAPNANSYRRFGRLSYAPMAPTWGRNNRFVALRIPAGPATATRIEHRTAGADANPYLVLAAVLGGVLHGLEGGIDPGPATTGNAYDTVPPSLPLSVEAALHAFENADTLPQALGTDFCRLYHTCRRVEHERFVQHITPVELDWYLHTV